MKDLDIKTSILFNLDFAKNTVLLCFFFFFLIIDLYFLILFQVFHPTAELALPSGIPTKEAKAYMETHPATVENKLFYPSYSSIRFPLFLQRNNFLFHLYFSI